MKSFKGGLLLRLVLVTIFMTWFQSGYAARPNHDFDKPAGAEVKSAKAGQCETALSSKPAAKRSSRATATETKSTPQLQAVHKIFTLSDFLNPDPTLNPAILHPGTVMIAAQKYWQLVGGFKPRIVREPLYGAKPVYIYPAFTGELPESEGKMIVGQHDAIDALVGFIQSEARGDGVGKMLLYVGPSGTGKTELLNVLDKIRVNLSRKNPDFFEYTYKWRNIDQVPALRPLLPTKAGQMVGLALGSDMDRSPFTLLRKDIQDEVIRLADPHVQEKIGFPLIAWRDPDPKSEEMIEEIFKHEFPDIRSGALEIDDIPADLYLATLEKYVDITRRKRDDRIANLIRATPDNPDFSSLFVSQNLAVLASYPGNSALASSLTGKAMMQDGGGMSLDEFFRNDPKLINVFLEAVQNRVVETDIGPAVKMDILPIATTNDESIASAKENGDMKAILDRSHMVPTRLNLHPHEISKTAILMLKPKNFSMRRLDVDENGKLYPLEPLDLRAVYPETPDATGNLLGAEGRYAVYYNLNERTQVLIAPHALKFMGLAAASTRFVTDPRALVPFLKSGEISILGPQSHYFTNVSARLNVILGNVQGLEESVRSELLRLKDLLHEGERGISSRDIESWLKAALKRALESEHQVLSPGLMAETLNDLLTSGTISPKDKDNRMDWLNRIRAVKFEFTLKSIYSDIRQIVSGDGERAERIYDAVLKELIALSADRSATEWTPDDGSGSRPINHERLRRIKDQFEKLHQREYSDGFLLRHLDSVSGSHERSRNQELLDAIQAYLVETEIDVNEVVTQVYEYYSGENTDPKVAKIAAEVEQRLARYGYNRAAFMMALRDYQNIYGEKVKAQARSEAGN